MMKTIKVHDKTFKLYMSADEIERNVRRLAEEISRDYQDKDPMLCPVLTGSYMFFADLTRYMTIDPDIRFVRYSSYSGMESTGTVKAVLPFPEKCRGRHVVIVEDIVDSGLTMKCMMEELQKMKPASIRVCSFFFKPDRFKGDFKIDYLGASIPDDFIVGYGLDYDDKGRTMKDVYSVML